MKRANSNTATTRAKKAGEVVYTSRFVVSKDGKALTITAKGLVHLTYRRCSAGPGSEVSEHCRHDGRFAKQTYCFHRNGLIVCRLVSFIHLTDSHRA